MFIGLSAELDNCADRGEDTQSEAEFGRRHISSSGRTGAWTLGSHPNLALLHQPKSTAANGKLLTLELKKVTGHFR